MLSTRRRSSSILAKLATTSPRLEDASVCKNKRLLGKGAFGIVCSRKGKAVKVQLKCSSNNEWCKNQKKHELEFFKKVARFHENQFMQLYHTHNDGKFLIMELEKMDGTFANDSDASETKRFFESNPRHHISFLLQLFSGLNFMRARGYNHTDLHQGNVAYIKCKSSKLLSVFPYLDDGTVAAIKKSNKQLAPIPSFGRIWKLIDYGLVTKSKQPNLLLVDERELFIRFLYSWKNAMSSRNQRKITEDQEDQEDDEFQRPQLNLEKARMLQPSKVQFVESLAPPSMMQIAGPIFMQENQFSVAYELLFGTEAYLDILIPDANEKERRKWKRILGSVEPMVSLEELVFYYQAKTSIETILIPRLLQRVHDH